MQFEGKKNVCTLLKVLNSDYVFLKQHFCFFKNKNKNGVNCAHEFIMSIRESGRHLYKCIPNRLCKLLKISPLAKPFLCEVNS